MKRNAARSGDKPAIIFEGQTITWDGLWQAIQAPSAYLSQRLGQSEQQVIDILMPNCIDFVIAYLSIVHSGHIALPLDPAYKSLELDNIIEQIPPRLIIANHEYKLKLGAVHQGSTLELSQLIPHKKTLQPLKLPANEQIASLTFTSGTTGRPKAVPNTHRNHIWNIEVCSEVWNWTANDRLLLSLPLSHMHGIVIGLTGAIYHANTIYLQRWFDEQMTLEALSSGKITLFTHAASAYVKLVQVKGDFDLSKVRLCISGAAPLPPAVWHEFKKRFGIEVLETYGTSETGRIAGNRLHERVLGSPGRPLPTVNVKLSPDGEVMVKSEGVFPGYYHNPEATKESLNSDGYWRTGDIAEIRDGYIFLKGREQERIRRFGYTVSPRDVEWALHQLPQVKDIYVMGRQAGGEPNDELIYFIVTDLSDGQIQDYCRQNLIFAWRPDKIVRLSELPKTRSGKAKIGELRQMVSNS